MEQAGTMKRHGFARPFLLAGLVGLGLLVFASARAARALLPEPKGEVIELANRRDLAGPMPTCATPITAPSTRR